MGSLEDLGISDGLPAYLVAEISANHMGNKKLCIDLIDIAKSTNVNAVKFQTYTPDTITLNSSEPDFLIPQESPWSSYSTLFELYSEAFTPWEWHEELFKYTESQGLLAFSSAFDETALAFLESLDSPLHKIASPEINHLPLIKKMAETGKPIIMSLGVASQYDLETALRLIQETSDSQVVILQCDTNYPSENSNANLKQLLDLKERYEKIVGYSDHTKSSLSGVVALALGAKVFEKHLTNSTDDRAIDSFFSSSGQELSDYVKDIRDAESTLGDFVFRTEPTSQVFRSKRSIYPKCDIEKGQEFSEKNIGIFRPGLSLQPEEFEKILGQKATRNLRKGERMLDSDIGI